MKKFALFCALAVALSTFSIGCSSDGSSSWCRSGSIWPLSRTRQNTETVYMTSGMSGGMCDVSACNPCESVCPNPCDVTCNGSVMPGTLVPGPVN